MGIFDELAQKKLNEVERPKPIPTGHYEATFTGMWKEHKAKSGNLALRYPMRLVAPTDDVDQEALAAMGGLPDKEYTFDFWMSPEAQYRFTEFAKSLGISDQLNLIEAAEEVGTGGHTFTIEVKHQPDTNNPENIYVRFDNPVGNGG